MPETQTPAQPAEAAAQAASTAASEQASADPAEGSQGASGDASKSNVQANEADTWAGLPDEFAWVKDKVSASNSEAARYRTQLREAQEQLANAKTPEEFEAARTELAGKNAELELELARERAARVHGLSDEDLEILDDVTDPTALEAKAQKLAARVKKDPAPPAPPKGDLRGGRGNHSSSDAPKEVDGRTAWRDFKRKRR